MARKRFVAGNWKMFTTVTEAVDLAKSVVAKAGSRTDVDIAICPPFVNLHAVSQVIKGTPVKLGAQDVHWEEKGAFTGKTSCSMLKSVGVEYVIIGHSEQRTYFHETDETVNKKVKAVLSAGMFPIICVGETLQERKNGAQDSVVKTQTTAAFAGVSAVDAAKCTIAYEPVWAIGTGETATPQQANDMHSFIRKIITGLYTEQLAAALRIQYGGSMKPGNAKELLGQTDVDGGLIGGAALKADEFAAILFA